MRSVGKSFSLLLIVILAVSSLMMVKPACAQITKPSIPEFTVKLVDRSYDVPASTSIDPYTGKTVTYGAEHVRNSTMEFTIKNQPFDSSNGFILYYDIRWKGHFVEIWTEVWEPHEFSIKMSDSDYTTIVFVSSGGGAFVGPDSAQINLPFGGQLDLQVEVFVGGYVPGTGAYPELNRHFVIEAESGWSNTQTLTNSDGSVTVSPSPTSTSSSTPTATPTLAPSPTPTPVKSLQNIFLSENPLLTTAVITAVLFLVVAVVSLLLYRRHQKNSKLGKSP
jgi:hypothetical protein